MSLSFVVPADEWGKHKVVGRVESTKNDEKVFERIEKEQAARGSKLKEYAFDMKMVEAFRYRMEDALRAVTRSAIKEARIKELKTEILNSDKLKVHGVSRSSLMSLLIRLTWDFRHILRIIHTIWNTSVTTNPCIPLESNLT